MLASVCIKDWLAACHDRLVVLHRRTCQPLRRIQAISHVGRQPKGIQLGAVTIDLRTAVLHLILNGTREVHVQIDLHFIVFDAENSVVCGNGHRPG
ncbi:hypothetical protein D3C85_1357590 [compost metagenome]